MLDVPRTAEFCRTTLWIARSIPLCGVCTSSVTFVYYIETSKRSEKLEWWVYQSVGRVIQRNSVFSVW